MNEEKELKKLSGLLLFFCLSFIEISLMCYFIKHIVT